MSCQKQRQRSSNFVTPSPLQVFHLGGSARMPLNNFVKVISKQGTLGKNFASVKRKVCQEFTHKPPFESGCLHRQQGKLLHNVQLNPTKAGFEM